MALNSIEIIKNAEVEAAEQISKAELDAKVSLQQAELKAKELLADSREKAKIALAHKADKAKEKADEIIISAQNSAKLKSEELKAYALSKQNSVNNEIFQIIV